jgi:sugar phosphate permease
VKISHENEEEETFTEQLKETTSYLKEFLSVPYNFVLSMDCMLIVSFHYNLLLWLPYYLEKTGHGADSSTIAFMYPLALVASPFLLEYFVSFCPNQVKYFTDTMLICNVVVFFILNAQKGQ